MELLTRRLQAKEAEIAQYLVIIENLQQQLKQQEEECNKCKEKNLKQKNQNQRLKKEKGK